MSFDYRRVVTESLLSVVAASSGVYTCMGCNDDCELAQTTFFVTTIPEGFHVEGPTQAVEGDDVELVCAASKYNYTDNSLGWFKQIGSEYVDVTALDVRSKSSRRMRTNFRSNDVQVVDVNPSKFDVGKRLRFKSVKPEHSGVYVCRSGHEQYVIVIIQGEE